MTDEEQMDEMIAALDSMEYYAVYDLVTELFEDYFFNAADKEPYDLVSEYIKCREE